jgi:hypothetical protein
VRTGKETSRNAGFLRLREAYTPYRAPGSGTTNGTKPRRIITLAHLNDESSKKTPLVGSRKTFPCIGKSGSVTRFIY